MRLALALLLLVAPGALGTDPIPTGNCGDSAYFDIDSLRCTTCPDGQRVVASGLACECAGDTVPVSVESAYDAGSDDYTAHCVACSTGLVPERASLHAALGGSCVPCGEDADPSSEVDFGTGTVADMLANYTVYVTCPNTTVSDPTLGECTGLEAPEARCTTSDDAAEYPECACPTGYVLAETNQHGGSLLSKRCELCAANAYPHLTDPRACTACDDPLMLWSGSGTECDCPSGWTTVTHTNGLWGLGSSCVLSSARSSVLGAVDDSTASRVTYSAVLAATSASGSADSVTLDSATLAQLFVPSAAGCLVAVTTGRSDAATPGRSACQALANLCVLADYDPDSASCKAYRFIQTKASGSVNGQSEWKSHMAWLYHSDAPVALKGTDLDLPVAVGAQSGTATVLFVLNSYTLNGTWLGLTNLTTQLQLCAASTADSTHFLNVGSSYEENCALDIAVDLAALADPLGAGSPDGTPSSGGFAPPAAASYLFAKAAALRGAFHDLYLRDAAGELTPVPVRVLNHKGGVNVNGDTADTSLSTMTLPTAFTSVDLTVLDDVYTRRFFLIDALSGRRDGGNAGALPEVVRYARTMQLTLRVSESNRSQMLPPLLSVTYAEALVGSTDSSSSSTFTATTGTTAVSSTASMSVPASFAATYTMVLVTYWSALTILIVFAAVFVFVGWLYASLAWVRRNQRVILDAEFAVMALVHILGAYADIFFWLIVILCAYWFIFFKAQTTAFLMLPSEESMAHLQLMLIIALVGKAVQVLAMVWRQSHADVFLIDWETAHGTLLGKQGEPAEDAPVSIWRTIFVANELNELQAARLTKPALSLVLVLAFMVGGDFERFGTAVPNGSADKADPSKVPSHLLLRFAVSTFVWGVVLVGQALLLKLVYLPYVEDKVGQLVDLLAVANVSALILPEPLCGYYLHGRSVHAHADASMLDLNKQLRAEEDGLTSQRGLSPSSEVQTFEVHLTPALREVYDQNFLHAALAEAAQPVTANTAPRRRAGNGGGQMNVPLAGVSIERARRAGDGFRSNPERAVARYVEMNALLRDFVDGSLPGHEYQIREKSYLEKLLRLPPDMSYARDSLFLYDSSGSWTRTLLYGREYDLCILEVLVYTVTDMSLRSSLVSAVITYVVWLAVEKLRSTLGQNNLAKKTLIDDRFLI